MLVVGLNQSTPSGAISQDAPLKARLIGFSSFFVGVYALLASIGAGGFIRSRRMGWTTASIASVAALFATWALVG